MKRRTFLTLALAAASAAAAALWLKPAAARAAPVAARPGAATRPGAAVRVFKWRNWSGNLSSQPQARFAPDSEQALSALLKTDHPLPLRPVGAGHSFSPLVPSDGSILSLDLLGDVHAVKKESAVIGGGARLRNLSQALAARGLAFRNLPDIDKQSLAGAVSTATHGTGKNFGSLSAEILSLRLMTAEGEVLFCSPTKNSELFSAAKVSLGVLGVLTQIEMRLTPAYRLRRRTWFEPYDKLVARAPALWEQHSKFEFYTLPFLNYCLAISHDKTDAETTLRPPSADEDGLRELKFLRDWFSWSNALRARLGKSALDSVPEEDVVGESYDLLASAREVRFNEMEYHLPVAHGLAALDEVKHVIETKHSDVYFPIEARIIKGDDAWLSPFQGGDRISVAVHAHYQDSYQTLFADVEKIFRKHHGRPHWGKINNLTKKDFAALYPDWEKFAAVRARLDRQGKFLNPYLQKLFDV